MSLRWAPAATCWPMPALSPTWKSAAPLSRSFVLGANGGVLKMRIKRLLGSRDDMAGSPLAAFVVLGVAAVLAGSYFVAISRAQSQSRPARDRDRRRGGADGRRQHIAGRGNGPRQSRHGAERRLQTWLEQDARWIITDREAQAFRQLTNR